MHFVFAPCYHCEKPLCQFACPNKAIYKEENYGAVLVRDELCRGERKCWKACPYGAPQFADDKAGTKMSKCNMCIDRLAQGQQPVCVLACPTRALDFGPMDKISQQYGNLRVLHQMPGEKKTMPSVIFKARTEKKKIIPHDPDRTLQLFSQGENTLLKYESVETMTNIPPGAVKRNRLVMKPRNCKELMEVTRNDEG